jgi:L-aspartate oxidase
VHGANRMAGNSLAQSCVFGHRVALSVAAARERKRTLPTVDPAPLLLAEGGPGSRTLAEVRATLRLAMTDGAGPIRDEASLGRAEAALQAAARTLGTTPHASRDAVELSHLVTVGELIVRAARVRTESRGVHWRSDFPDHSPDWAGRRTRIVRPAEHLW